MIQAMFCRFEDYKFFPTVSSNQIELEVHGATMDDGLICQNLFISGTKYACCTQVSVFLLLIYQDAHSLENVCIRLHIQKNNCKQIKWLTFQIKPNFLFRFVFG